MEGPQASDSRLAGVDDPMRLEFPAMLPSKTSRLTTVFAVVALAAVYRLARAEEVVSIKQLDGRLRVKIDGKLFTEYIYRGYEKPILYPVIGPHGFGMTRNYPMRKDVPGEAHDHVHHKSIWFAHRPISGIDFWSTYAEAGKSVHDRLIKVESGSSRGVIEAATRWITREGRVAFTDTRRLTFHLVESARAIDWEITIQASHGDVTFGDSKEGTMAIRTHPNLRLDNDPKRGVTTANGQALNSEGVSGKAVWGRRARWIDYWGKIEGKTVGIAILDHPANPRHPTHWMARGYGYVGANPFGLNAFEGKPPGTGDMLIKSGTSVTFRYRYIFHEGDATQANVDRLWKQYAAESDPAGRK